MTLVKIENYLSKMQRNEPLQVDQCTMVENPKKTLTSLVSYMKGNKGNKRFMSYYKLAIKIIEKNEEI